MKKTKRISLVLLTTILTTSVVPVNALTKNETVYSKLNSDGSVKSTVVSEYLKNDNEVISDETNLKNILNLNGNEKYKLQGTNITWEAKGKDIYYQGETEEKLPISLDITYKLNGKNIELKDLLGKKGKVTIDLKYTNYDKHVVAVNGKEETLYTPFVVTVGTIISNKNNSNIEVTNGKIVSNGKNSVVVAIASPGLYESLKSDSLKDFDTVTITFDTKSFELSSIYSAVSSKLISEDDLKVFNKLDNVYTKIDTLSTSSKQLVNGSNELLAGTKKLNEGINKVYEGSKTLSDVLTNKINEVENNSSIDEATLNYVQSQATSGAVQQVESTESYIKASASNGVDEYINGINQLLAYYGSKCEPVPTDECPAEIQVQYTQAKAVKQVLNSLDTLGEERKAQVVQVFKSITSTVAYETAKSTAQQTASGVSSSVAVEVADVAKNTTVESLKTLNTNITTLKNGLKELSDGTNNLSNGVSTLASGITKFDSEGIDAIAKLVNGDIKTVEGKLKALVKLGNAYDTFTMKPDDVEGETKFVLIVDAEKKSVKKTTNRNKK